MNEYTDKDALKRMIIRSKTDIASGPAHERVFGYSIQALFKLINDAPAADVRPAVWIDASRTPPKASGRYYVLCNHWGGYIHRVATWLEGTADQAGIWLEGAENITDYVTHWMPPPDPPERETSATSCGADTRGNGND